MIRWQIPAYLYTKLTREHSFHLFRYRGMWCFIQRSMVFGNLCGYVSVEPHHPLYSKNSYDSIVVPDDAEIRYNGNVFGLLGMMGSGLPSNIVRIDMYIQVHCGITWSRKYAPGIQLDSLGKLWWFGFDTSHAGDAQMIQFCMPGHEPDINDFETYKDYDYVLTEVYKLADQLADMLPRRQLLIDISPFIDRLNNLKEKIAV